MSQRRFAGFGSAEDGWLGGYRSATDLSTAGVRRNKRFGGTKSRPARLLRAQSRVSTCEAGRQRGEREGDGDGVQYTETS